MHIPSLVPLRGTKAGPPRQPQEWLEAYETDPGELQDELSRALHEALKRV
jgi:hypothetical protein